MEPWSFEMSMTGFTLLVLCLFAAVPVAFLIVTRREGWGDARSHQMSMRARLPFGTDTVHRSVKTRLRREMRVNMWCLLGTIVVMGVVLLTTPIASIPYVPWVLTLLVASVVLASGSLVSQLRERLFSPALDAPRIARTAVLRARDYLGFWHAFTPVLLLYMAAATTLAVGGATVAGWLTSDVLIATTGLFALAIVATIGTRFAERRILAQPQPASDTLELAWDDLFRADALRTLRMVAAMAAWLPVGLGAALLLSRTIDLSLMVLVPASSAAPTLSGVVALFPWWGLPALQVVYALGSGRLPAALYPDWLRQPALIEATR